jgi:hypothetical protein
VHDLTRKEPEPELPSHTTPLLEAANPDAVSAVTDDTAAWWLREPPAKRKKKPWPKDVNASPARIRTTYECLEKWHQRYREKRPDPPGPEAVVGKLVHGALEDAAARRVRRERKIPWIASTQELLHLLDHQPTQLLEEGESVTVNPGTFAEARELVAALPGQDFRFTWAVEHLWQLRVTHDLVVGGYIDRIDLLGDPERPTTVLIPDYKSTQLVPSRDELAQDHQAGLYMAWAHRRWPECGDIRFLHDNVRHRKRVQIEWNQGLEDLHLAQARAAFGVWSIGDRTPSPGDACRRCPYREGDEGHAPCMAYQQVLERTRFRADREAKGGLERLSTEDLLVVYREASWSSRLQEDRRKAAGALLKVRLAGQKSYRVGDLIAIQSRDTLRSFIGVDAMVDALTELSGVPRARIVADLFSVRVGRLDAWVKALPPEKKKLIEAALERHVDEFLGAPSLEVRRSQSMF